MLVDLTINEMKLIVSMASNLILTGNNRIERFRSVELLDKIKDRQNKEETDVLKVTLEEVLPSWSEHCKLTCCNECKYLKLCKVVDPPDHHNPPNCWEFNKGEQ